MSAGSKTKRGYRDLQEHLAALQDAGLLVTIDEPIDKDRHLQPLVRWQFRGGMPESERKAFLFTNVTDAKGRRYDIPVLVGALAANPDIYCIGMGVDRDEIGALWQRAIANPIAPRIVTEAPCHEVVIDGAALQGEGNGMDALPIPISSPGFDVAPYLTMTACITRDPETGTQNMGTYRAGLKAPDRLAVRMVVRPGGRKATCTGRNTRRAARRCRSPSCSAVRRRRSTPRRRNCRSAWRNCMSRAGWRARRSMWCRPSRST